MKSARAPLFMLVIGMLSSRCRRNPTEAVLHTEAQTVLAVDPAILGTQAMPWSARSDYVAVNVPFEPVAALKKQIEQRESVSIKSRGEAHITVITPQELVVLKSRLTLEQINGAVEKMKPQSAPFELQCVGRGLLRQGAKSLQTWFVVVKAPGLLSIRDKLRQQFVAAGGDKPAFAADAYYPHITVGFTDRDLHATDGVIKDGRNCVYRLE